MKNQQREQAQDLYFKDNLNKTEIASQLGINRRTVMLWAQQGNWDKLRKSAQQMPALIAEKCYYLLDQYITHLLTDGAIISNFSIKEARTISILTTSINRIKNRCTTNESMELCTFFHEGLKRRDEKLAADILPHIETFISSRASASATDFLLEGFSEDGTLPYPEKEIKEQWQDEKDRKVLMEELEDFLNSRQSPPDTLSPAPQPAPTPATPPASTALHSSTPPQPVPINPSALAEPAQNSTSHSSHATHSPHSISTAPKVPALSDGRSGEGRGEASTPPPPTPSNPSVSKHTPAPHSTSPRPALSDSRNGEGRGDGSRHKNRLIKRLMSVAQTA